MNTGGQPQAERPIALAREAAMRAIETMQPQDYVGLLTFTDQFSWNVPVHQLGSGLELREVLDAVSQVEATGGTQMYQAMVEGLAALGSLPPGAPSARHVLILSDGQSNDGSLETFRQLAQSGQQAGITISTIAFGEDADTDVMAEIAEAGNGRYYAVSQAGDLPRILIYESQAARSENIQAGQTSLKPGEAGHPILSGLSPSQLPVLSGYNALSSRAEEGAEDVLLSSSFGDPILSAWQYRLGRVVAWTGDLGEEWTGDWPSAERAGLFWSQVVRYAQASPALGPAQVSVQVEATRLSVDASILDAGGMPVNHSQVRFSYADAAGEIHSFAMPQTGPGLYHLELPTPPEGAYRATIDYQDENGQAVEAPAPFVVNSPAEWLPQLTEAGEPDPARNLQRWAERTGGSLALLETHLASGTQPQAGAAGAASARRAPWWQWALLALVLLWPLEIAIRRRWLPWS